MTYAAFLLEVVTPKQPFPVKKKQSWQEEMTMRVRWFPYVLLLFAGVTATAVIEAAELGLEAGAAAVDITPQEFPLNMPGGFRANLADEAHDPLFARTLTLRAGGTTVSLTVVDSLGVDPALIEAAKAAAAGHTGMVAEKMLICSTHTHTGPPSSGSSGAAAAYRERLLKGITDSIVRAHAEIRPARFAAASWPLPSEVFNRRWFLKPGRMEPNPFGEMDRVKMNPPNRLDVLDRPAGPTDPDVSILSVQTRQGKPLALFANYALHYVGGVPRGKLSADYFGEFARLMPSRLRAGDGFVAMLSNGASGDINNIPFATERPPREPFEQIRLVATKAADAAWAAHGSIADYQVDPRLDMRERWIDLRYRRPDEAQVARAREIVMLSDEEAEQKLPRLAKAYARRTIQAAEREEDSVTVPLQAVRIGDVAICGIPFETFVEIGLELKHSSPFKRTVVIGLANGRHGYLPTTAQHRLGGYETWLGTNRVQKDAADIIIRHLTEMLAELHESGD